MPSPQSRRIRSLVLTAILFVLVTLYVTSGARQTRSSDFYIKTTEALQEKKLAAEAAAAADSDVSKRLREAEVKAKQAAHSKAEPIKEELMQAHKEAKEETSRLEAQKKAEEGQQQQQQKSTAGSDGDRDGVKSVAGRKYMKNDGIAAPKVGDKQEVEKADSPAKTAHVQSQEERLVEEELNTILKRSPSMLDLFTPRCGAGSFPTNKIYSYHILKDILSFQQEGEEDPTGEIQHYTAPIRCGIG